MSDEKLRSHRFTRDMDSTSVSTLASCSLGEVSWKKGEWILTTGDEAKRCYLLMSGDVHIETTSPGRPATELQTIHGGDLLGWSWLIPPYRWAFDARAATDVTAVALDAKKLRVAAESDCTFGYALLTRMFTLVSDRLQATRLQLMDLYGPRA
ncbi:MAG TPA: cyclic nucleotide-binding domain-containing protein [Acidimicrobiia bacterium]|nr:cyclic nucleotide-binding domain-containing protein [Acidimicrobiia bacterium]